MIKTTVVQPVHSNWRFIVERVATLMDECMYSSCDALIIVPPGATLEHPAIGPHLLAAWAEQSGFRVGVLYANMIFAAMSGEDEHQSLCTMSEQIWGERVFCQAAYGTPLLGKPSSSNTTCTAHSAGDGQSNEWLKFHSMARLALPWAENLSKLLVRHGPRVIGCSSMFQQNAASLALLQRVKRLSADHLTIMGGPNCHGVMAEGLISLSDELDYAFSGEADQVFPEFLQAVSSKLAPQRGVIAGTPLLDMDTSPAPCYREFYDQLERLLPDSRVKREGKMSLPYETSRGCWWGEKHHCTFCGLNANGMVFRAKSPERVIGDLRKMLVQHPNRLVNMVDNIMPHQYFRTLLPRLAQELPNLQVFYEQKSNLSLGKVAALRQAGVTLVQPGIESLSTPLLKRMKKGVTAGQNIDLLRYCRSVGVTLVWNILYGFPGDLAHEYDSMLNILPKLKHLNPPSGVFSVCIERFSPYFERPQEYGITNLRPAQAYATFLPQRADIGKIGSQFEADFSAESLLDETVAAELWRLVIDWHQPWRACNLPYWS